MTDWECLSSVGAHFKVFVVNQAINFNEAKARCEQEEGQATLGRVSSAEEFEFVLEIAEDLISEMYIGKHFFPFRSLINLYIVQDCQLMEMEEILRTITTSTTLKTIPFSSTAKSSPGEV